jgi:hypothetical protein
MENFKKYLFGAVVWCIATTLFTFLVLWIGSLEANVKFVAIDTWRLAFLLFASQLICLLTLIKVNR